MRIDPDEIRSEITGYNGSNAYLFQGAISDGVNRIMDHCQVKNKSFILDGTFSKYDTSKKNVERDLSSNNYAVSINIDNIDGKGKIPYDENDLLQKL